MIRVHDVLPRSSIYGPGERWVLWVQGCTLGCKGCWNVETWSRRTGTERTVASLVSELEAAASAGDLEGISLLGGEPLQQAEPVLELIHAAREMGLSVCSIPAMSRRNTTPRCRPATMARTWSSAVGT